MRRFVSVAAVAGLLLTGCGDDKPPVPANVAGLDACGLLTDEELTGLHLKVKDRSEEGHRRSCSFIATDLGDDPREDWINILELTIRNSPAPNRVADAKRLAETYRRERDANLTTMTVEGRQVYQVGPAAPIGCRLLLHVNATSSLEAAPMMDGKAPGCMHPDLARLLSAKLPVPDPAPARADHDRPVDVLALDPCNLISADKRTGLRLDAGRFSATVARSCSYHTGATAGGEVSSVRVTIWTSGAPGSANDEPTVREVNGRTAYEERDSVGGGPGAVSMCDYRLEVTTATSVQISSSVLGQESIDAACRTTAELAADIEPRLPLIVT
ncbi:MAG TPA: DUF3558 family protein [Micromonospora sp.]